MDRTLSTMAASSSLGFSCKRGQEWRSERANKEMEAKEGRGKRAVPQRTAWRAAFRPLVRDLGLGVVGLGAARIAGAQ